MKDRLAGTAFGGFVFGLREWFDLRSIPLSNPEKAGMIANDIIADRLVLNLCIPNGVFLDVGAHIGTIFSMAARNGDNIRTFAVEADPDKVRALEKRFPDTKIFNCAVGEQDETASFYRDTTLSGYSSLAATQKAGVETFEVAVRRLDDLMGDQDVDVMKIDIEGAELGALRGATAIINQSRPTIMFESTGIGENALGHSAQGVWEFFDKQDYDVLVPDRVAHNGSGLSKEMFLDAHVYPIRTHNYFAIARARRTEIRDRARVILGVRQTQV